MQPSIGAPPAVTRAVFYRELHQRFARQEFDNWVVWAGNDRVVIGGVEYASTLARAYIQPGSSGVQARVRCELFVAEIDLLDVRSRDTATATRMIVERFETILGKVFEDEASDVTSQN